MVAGTFAMAALMEFFLREEVNGDDLRQFREEDAESIQQRMLLSVLKKSFLFPVNEVLMGIDEEMMRQVPNPVTVTKLVIRDRSPERQKNTALLQTEAFPRVIVLKEMEMPEELPTDSKGGLDLALTIILIVAYLTSREQKKEIGVLTRIYLRNYVCSRIPGVEPPIFNKTMESFKTDIKTWMDLPPDRQPIRIQHDPTHTYRVVLTEYGFLQISHLCRYRKWALQQGRKIPHRSRDEEGDDTDAYRCTETGEDGQTRQGFGSLLPYFDRLPQNHISIVEQALTGRLRPLTVGEICHGIDLVSCGWAPIKNMGTSLGRTRRSLGRPSDKRRVAG